MTTQDRINDIMGTGLFNENEIEQNDGGFESWEYHSIFHFTNEEWYYTDDEYAQTLQRNSDKERVTEKGIIFCFS